MKLEFLYKINEFNEHAVRLSDFNSQQANLFRDALANVVITQQKSLDVHTLEFVESVNCLLTLRISNQDIGIEEVEGKHFYCDLTLEGYNNMYKLLTPFCLRESKGYQWMYEIDTPIDLLFSAGGY